MNAPHDASTAAAKAERPPDAVRTRPRRREKRTYSRHGLNTLKAAVRSLGPRVVDRRTTLGKQLARWRADLVADLGGSDAVSTAQLALVDLAVKSKLMLDSIDAWLLVQPTLVNLRRRALLPAVRERQALADALARYLGQLGLERRRTPSVGELLEPLNRRDDGAPRVYDV